MPTLAIGYPTGAERPLLEQALALLAQMRPSS